MDSAEKWRCRSDPFTRREATSWRERTSLPPACRLTSRIARSEATSKETLLDPRDPSLRRETLKLQRIMPWNDALHRSCQFDHPFLVLDVGGLVCLGKGGACFMFREVPVEIAIVRGQHERWTTFNAQILRRIRVTRPRVGANPGENFHVVAVHQTQPSLRVQLHQLADVFRIDAIVLPTGLPCFSRVVSEFVLLNPYGRPRKQIDPAHVIPMRVADHDVRDFVGLHPRELHGFIRAQIIGYRKILEPLLPMESAVEENIPPATADQPRRVGISNRLNGGPRDGRRGNHHGGNRANKKKTRRRGGHHGSQLNSGPERRDLPWPLRVERNQPDLDGERELPGAARDLEMVLFALVREPIAQIAQS